MATRFQGEDYDKARDESAHIELAVRAILRMFADGRLTYRPRDQTVRADISSSSGRVRRIRAQAARPAPVVTPAA